MHGKTPFYSHEIENAASAGVARSLRLLQFTQAVAYSPPTPDAAGH
jgi:hypothetical protein